MKSRQILKCRLKTISLSKLKNKIIKQKSLCKLKQNQQSICILDRKIYEAQTLCNIMWNTVDNLNIQISENKVNNSYNLKQILSNANEFLALFDKCNREKCDHDDKRSKEIDHLKIIKLDLFNIDSKEKRLQKHQKKIRNTIIACKDYIDSSDVVNCFNIKTNSIQS